MNDGIINKTRTQIYRSENKWANERVISKGIIVIKERKVYDIVIDTWSTGYWIPIYDRFGHIIRHVPVWRDWR